MGCRCGGKRGVGKRPIVTPKARSVQTGLAAAKTPRQIRSQARQEQVSVLSAEIQSGMSKERREIERKRRAQIVLRRQAGNHTSSG